MAELGQKPCPECGALNQLGAKFCDQCRAAFPATEPDSPVAWRVVNQWRDHYEENGRGTETPEEAVATFNETRNVEEMRELSHLSFVAALLEKTDDPMEFRVLAWRPLTPDYDAGVYLLGDPVAGPPPTTAFSYFESKNV